MQPRNFNWQLIRQSIMRNFHTSTFNSPYFFHRNVAAWFWCLTCISQTMNGTKKLHRLTPISLSFQRYLVSSSLFLFFCWSHSLAAVLPSEAPRPSGSGGDTELMAGIVVKSRTITLIGVDDPQGAEILCVQTQH